MSHLQRFLKHTAGDLLVTSGVLRDLYVFAWDSYPNETGGVLLGHAFPGSCETAVSQVIGPGPRATHASTTFEPDHEWQAEAVALRWYDDPTLEYLGDWHTHPGGTTNPSKLDKDALEVIASSADAQQAQPLMLIVALGSAATTLSATRFSGTRFDRLRIRIES
jgi:integrative and conjugative element protein (TIGR02256 family)